MSTDVRPETSTKNRYWISKHHYYELKHFCLQYPEWKRASSLLDDRILQSHGFTQHYGTSGYSDPTARNAIAKAYFDNYIETVERMAKSADKEIGDYILKAVTEGLSYDYLKTRLEMPCSKDMYYDRYRKFFWLLGRER